MTRNFILKISTWIENKSSNRFYVFYLSVFLMACSLIFAMPDFSSFNPGSFAWKTVSLKAADLLNPLTHIDPHSWLSKKVFRLTVPFIVSIVNLSPVGIIILQYLTGLFTLMFCYLLSRRITKDTVSATFVAIGIAFIYFGRAGFYDLKFTWFDGIAFFSLIASMYSRNVLIIFFFSLCAAWSDERGFVALFIVLLFHVLDNIRIQELNLRQLINFNRRSFVVVLAIISYLALRLFLSLQYNMHTNSVEANLTLIGKTAPYLAPGMWTFLEGFWLIFSISLFLSFKNRHYLFSTLILVVLVVFVFISGSVTDITRSGSYMTPVIFILVGYLSEEMKKYDLRKLLFRSAFISFIFPALIVCPDWGWGDGMSSFFINIYRHFMG